MYLQGHACQSPECPSSSPSSQLSLSGPALWDLLLSLSCASKSEEFYTSLVMLRLYAPLNRTASGSEYPGRLLGERPAAGRAGQGRAGQASSVCDKAPPSLGSCHPSKARPAGLIPKDSRMRRERVLPFLL